MEKDLATLQLISDVLKDDPNASQRTLAQRSNMSLGMMNAILKRFVERGWIMLTNVNNRKLAYALTAEGLTELTNRGKKFALRTFQLAHIYGETFCKYFRDAKSAGKTKVVLYGDSYIKFIIEYACKNVDIEFQNTQELVDDRALALCLIGELNDIEIQDRLAKEGFYNLFEVLKMDTDLDF